MLLRGNSSVRADITRSRLDRLKAIDGQLKELTAQIGELVTATGSRLLEIPGCGVLTAGRILGQTGDVRRFRDRNAYAAGNGTAPIPASSGTTIRNRLNRPATAISTKPCTPSPSSSCAVSDQAVPTSPSSGPPATATGRPCAH